MYSFIFHGNIKQSQADGNHLYKPHTPKHAEQLIAWLVLIRKSYWVWTQLGNFELPDILANAGDRILHWIDHWSDPVWQFLCFHSLPLSYMLHMPFLFFATARTVWLIHNDPKTHSTLAWSAGFPVFANLTSCSQKVYERGLKFKFTQPLYPQLVSLQLLLDPRSYILIFDVSGIPGGCPLLLWCCL